MTAAHVVNEATAHGTLILDGPSDDEGHPLGGARVDKFEVFLDVAVLFCTAASAATPLKRHV